MNLVDWLIVALALVLVPVGFRQGLIVGMLALGGFALGAVVGARVGPLVLADGSDSPYAPLAALLGGILLGAVVAVVAEDLGGGLRRRFAGEGARRTADSIGGALVTTVLAVAVAWVFGAAALNAPALEGLRAEVQRSAILSAVNEAVPPTGPILNVLNRIQPIPEIAGPSADVAAPKRGILADPELRAATGSVVRVVGNACGVGVSGSGWVGAPGVVVTNAHVIAGQEETEVELGDGSRLGATAIAYRPKDDIALLSVEGLDLAALPLVESPEAGTAGAVAGYPGGGELSLVPARLGTTARVRSQDSYGRGPILRRIASLRGRVRSGNSGGPMIDAEGAVLTTVFATSTSSERPEGLGVPNLVVAKLLAGAGGPTGTGPCA